MPIEGIAIGDLVYSRNEETGENELKPVTDIFDRISRDMVVMTLEAPTGEVVTVRATPEHPFLTLDGGWTEAGSLKAGDFVFDIDGGSPTTVKLLVFEIVSEKVYNFEVAELHNYFVSEDGILSHNGKKGDKCGCSSFGDPKLDNIMDQIVKRESELKADKLGLPEFGSGKNRCTRQGHRRIIKRLWNNFFKRMDKLDQ
jgi:pretoxin HINT domain-containing protein